MSSTFRFKDRSIVSDTLQPLFGRCFHDKRQTLVVQPPCIMLQTYCGSVAVPLVGRSEAPFIHL